MKTEFAKFLFRKLQDYERELGHRVTISQFAEHLNVSQSNVSYWLNGKVTPSLESAFVLAPILGPEIYQYLDLDLDKDLIYINQHWPKLDQVGRLVVRECAEKYLATVRAAADQQERRDQDAMTLWRQIHQDIAGEPANLDKGTK